MTINPRNNTSRFKNSNGMYLVRELFYETALNKSNVQFTLKREDHAGYPSLYRLYMETNDPTEYRFAVDILDGWEHWKLLSDSTILKDLVSKWREELQILIRSENLVRLRENASKSTKEALTAQKYLLDGGWDQKSKTSRGRPSKAQIQQTADMIVQDKKKIEEDYERLMN